MCSLLPGTTATKQHKQIENSFFFCRHNKREYVRFHSYIHFLSMFREKKHKLIVSTILCYVFSIFYDFFVVVFDFFFLFKIYTKFHTNRKFIAKIDE